MKNVAVIGAGTMGNGIAHTFAQYGYKVSLIDIAQSSLDKAIATITKNLDRQVAKEKISEGFDRLLLLTASVRKDVQIMLIKAPGTP